ncbi:MAG: hypothetical protein WKF55_08085 [Gemmatimonadaceae bacterium]
MKKTSAKSTRRSPAEDPDEIRPEYDWTNAVRNPYASQYAAGSNIVVLEPDVAALFPNSASVNEALRSLASVIASRQTKRPSRRRTA